MRGKRMRNKLAVLVALAGLLTGTSMALGGLAGAGGPPAPVTVTITKTVVGTDPGIAFPITLTCDSVPVEDDDFQIPNAPGQASGVVNLRHGEQTTVAVTLPNSPPDSDTCWVTEDLSGVALPAGMTCTPAVAPQSAVVYDGEDWTDASFTVTNTCTQQAVVAAIRFTG